MKTNSEKNKATETERSVVAVFYQTTPNCNQPPFYKLFSVLHGSHTVTELPVQEQQYYDL